MLVYVVAAHLFSRLHDISLGDCNTVYTSSLLLMDTRMLPGFAMTNNVATNILVYTCNKYLLMELLGHKACMFATLFPMPNCFTKLVMSIQITTGNKLLFPNSVPWKARDQ